MRRMSFICVEPHSQILYDEDMEKEKKRNAAVDMLKLIFSLCIIGIHIQLFSDVSVTAYRLLTQALFRLGVPFYFITSGYYFTGKLNDRRQTDSYLLKLLKIYLVFEVLDIILTGLAPGMHYPFSYVILRIFTTGLNRIYWYLISLILTCFLCRPLWQKGYVIPLILFGLFLYLITMTYDSYSFLFADTFMAEIGRIHAAVWVWPQGGFAESVLFLSLGVYLRQNEPKIPHQNALQIIFLLCLAAEGYLTQACGGADANCLFSLIPCSVLLFLHAQRHPDVPSLPRAGEISLYVYMIHMYYSFVSYAFSPLTIPRFLITASLSLLTAVLIVRLKHMSAGHGTD